MQDNNNKTPTDSSMSIIIDIEDKTNQINNQSFYFNPNRLNSISLLAHDMFDSLKIKNCETEKLSQNILTSIYKTLQPLAKCEIIVYNPNPNLIENDIKVLESNIKMSGYTNFYIQPKQEVFIHPISKEYTSYIITFIKPDRYAKHIKKINIDKIDPKWEINSKNKIKEVPHSLSQLKEEVSKKINTIGNSNNNPFSQDSHVMNNSDNNLNKLNSNNQKAINELDDRLNMMNIDEKHKNTNHNYYNNNINNDQNSINFNNSSNREGKFEKVDDFSDFAKSLTQPQNKKVIRKKKVLSESINFNSKPNSTYDDSPNRINNTHTITRGDREKINDFNTSYKSPDPHFDEFRKSNKIKDQNQHKIKLFGTPGFDNSQKKFAISPIKKHITKPTKNRHEEIILSPFKHNLVDKYILLPTLKDNGVERKGKLVFEKRQIEFPPSPAQLDSNNSYNNNNTYNNINTNNNNSNNSSKNNSKTCS